MWVERERRRCATFACHERKASVFVDAVARELLQEIVDIVFEELFELTARQYCAVCVRLRPVREHELLYVTSFADPIKTLT